MSDINVQVNDFPIQVNVTNGNISPGVNTSYVTGVSGVLQKQITDSGAYLLSQIHVSNAGVNSLNGLSGIVNLTGAGSNTITLNGQNIIISGAAIPVNISGYITTGDADLRYYLITNPQGYIKSGEVIGIYYPLTNPAGYITGFNSGLYTLNSQTGNFTGIFVTRLETGQFNTGNLIGYATINLLQQTGQQTWLAAQNNALNLSGNLAQTGTSLDNKINSLSGYSNNTFYLKTNPEQYIKSGDVAATYSTILNVQNTGQVLYNLIGGLSGKLDLTGTNLQNQINTLISNLTQTGVTIEGQINSLSGYSNNNFATISNLQTTGQNLYILLTGESGALLSTINASGSYLFGLINASSAGVSSLNGHSGAINLTGAGNVNIIVGGQTFTISGNTGDLAGYATLNQLLQTGQQAWITANNNGINLSGNLQATGSTLDNKINSLSGYSNNTFATQTSLNTTNFNLTQTGVTLGAKIDSLSGYSNNTFATIVNLQNTGQNLYNLLVNASGVLNSSGALDARLQSTGSFLFGLINASSAGVSSINSKSGVISMTGAGNVTVISTTQNFTISGNTGDLIGYATINNLTSTGVTLGAKIDSLSGYSNNTFATITNLQTTGQNAWNTTNNNGINLSGNLQTTGQTNYNLVIGLSGKLDATGTNLQNQINLFNSKSYITGISITGGTGITGLFNLTGDNTINRSVSGQWLNESVNTNVIATVANLLSTGQQNYNLTIGLSGKLDATGTNLQNQINTLTTNLIQTGVNIEAQISLINQGTGNFVPNSQTGQFYPASNPQQYIKSGDVSNTYATLINLASTGQQAWTAANNNGINLSGNLQSTGSYLLGLIGGSTAGVSSLNNKTGAMFITGVGTVIVTTTGQIITISGVSPVTGGTIAFDFGLINLNTGSQNSQFIQFHQNFANTPNVYGNLINNSGDGIVASIISGTSISGFYVNFSEILTTNNYYFDYLATTGVGFYNFALSTINTIIGSIGNITGNGTDSYIPQFTSDGQGIKNSVVSGNSTGIYVSGIVTITDKIIVPNANFRVKDGQMQFWDSGAWAVDNTKPWRALGVFSGATIWSAPILD